MDVCPVKVIVLIGKGNTGSDFRCRDLQNKKVRLRLVRIPNFNSILFKLNISSTWRLGYVQLSDVTSCIYRHASSQPS